MITDRYDIVTTLLRYIRLKISFWPKKYIFGMLSKLITTFVASVMVLDFRNHLIDAKITFQVHLNPALSFETWLVIFLSAYWHLTFSIVFYIIPLLFKNLYLAGVPLISVQAAFKIQLGSTICNSLCSVVVK